jgi:hypothetical protein
MKFTYIAWLMTVLMSACSANPPDPSAPLSAAAVVSLVNTVAVPLKNPSFTTGTGGLIADWSAKEHSEGRSFTFSLDDNEPYSAPTSARIQRVGAEIYGILDQRVQMQTGWSGKVARLSAALKTEKVDSFGAGLILQAIGDGDAILEWNHMNDKRVTGSTPWQRYAVELTVPGTAVYIRVGVMLEGGGILWADDVKLEIVN